MHEFLHAFGLFHEHTREDRDNHVQVNLENIQPGTEINFQKFGTHDINDYDGLSVMHYGAKDFSKDPSLYTLESKVNILKIQLEKIQISMVLS